MKLWYGSSVGRSFHPDNVTDLIRLFTCGRPIYWRPVSGDALIERSRSISATRFLKSDAEVMLSIDTDIRFDHHAALQICDQAVTHDIVVGAYTTRSPMRSFVTSEVYAHQPIEFATDPTPVPIKWGATGFMAVHRRVYERLAESLPLCHEGEWLEHYPFYLPFVVDEDGKPIMLSEDYALCERARQAGFGVFLNPAVRLGHIGDYCYRLEDMTIARPRDTFPIRFERLTDGSPAQFRVERPDYDELERAADEAQLAQLSA